MKRKPFLATEVTEKSKGKSLCIKLTLWSLCALWQILFLIGCGGTETAEVINMSGDIMLSKAHGGDGAAWGLSSCESCHPLSVIHKNAGSAIREMVGAKGYETCMGCHGDNGTGNKRQCVVCHNQADMPNLPDQSGNYSHTFVTGSIGNISDEGCLYCHPLSDMNGKFELNTDLTKLGDAQGNYTPYASENDFCTRCHTNAHHRGGMHGCTHCHSIHGANSSGLAGMGGMRGSQELPLEEVK